MLPSRLRLPLLVSTIATILAQVLLAAVTAAVTGGGDFPMVR